MATKDKIEKILRIAGYTAVSLLAVITLVAGYGGAVNPDTSTLPAIFSMTFPVWLALSVVTLVIALIINRRLAIITGGSLLFCLGPILSFSPINVTKATLDEAEQKRSFTFMTYNVFGLNDYLVYGSAKDSRALKEEVKHDAANPTLEWIYNQDIDIVCLQEFYLRLDSTNIGRTLFTDICKRYPYRTAWRGAAILSKYPLYPVEIKQPDEMTCFIAGAVVEVMGHRTLVVSAHLQSIGLGADDKVLYKQITSGDGGKEALKAAKTQLLGKLSHAFRNRAIQVRDLRENIDSLGIENVIVAGDFNDIPDSYATRLLTSDDFRSVFKQCGLGPTITYHANRFYFNIDHILYRGEMEAVRYHRYSFGRSDHYPVAATFLWEEDADKVNRNLKGIDLIDRKGGDTAQ